MSNREKLKDYLSIKENSKRIEEEVSSVIFSFVLFIINNFKTSLILDYLDISREIGAIQPYEDNDLVKLLSNWNRDVQIDIEDNLVYYTITEVIGMEE